MRQAIQLLAITVILSLACPALAGEAAYVLLYHHVDRNTPASTSVTPEQFAVHMNYLESEGFHIVPLMELLEAIARGHTLPEKSVAITFDDAYPSVLQNALPVLEYHHWPFTVFVSTEAVDRGTASYLSWDDLRELEQHGGNMANHSHQHAHLVARAPEESEAEWRERVRGDIRFAQSRLDAELRHPVKLFSYPYGEFDPDLVSLVAELGYLAVGQQSGPLGPSSSPLAAPRFPMTEGLANLPTVSEKLKTLPFGISGPRLPATLLLPTEEAPTLELELQPGPFRTDEFTCFVAGQNPARVEWPNGTPTRVRITARDPLPVGRSKYTCTAPHDTLPGVYYWYSHLFMKPPLDGSWYDG